MKVCKAIILKKLRFSKKFLRKVLYSRKIALGISLIKPSIIIAALALKRCISYKRMKSNISKMIDINEEIEQIQYGYKINPMNTLRSSKLKNLIWNDEIENILLVRNMNLINTTNDK